MTEPGGDRSWLSTPVTTTSGPDPRSSPSVSRSQRIGSAKEFLERHGYRVTPREHDNGSELEPNIPDASTIWRTVICSEGSRNNTKKTYYSFDDEELYDSVRDTDLSTPLELVKEVKIISRSAEEFNLLRTRQRANEALGGAIVDQVTREKIVVRCPLLAKCIREIVYWPSTPFRFGSKSLELSSPFRSIGVNRQKFSELQNKLESEVDDGSLSRDKSQFDASGLGSGERQENGESAILLKHLRLFLAEVDRIQSVGVEAELERHKSNMATFDYLWLLFHPGKLVYVSLKNTEIACRVQLLQWTDQAAVGLSDDGYLRVKVLAWYLDHDGTSINRRQITVDIDRFDGEKSITELQVYPCDKTLDWDVKQRNKIERGKDYIRIIQNRFKVCTYNGMMSDSGYKPWEEKDHKAFNGKVMIDPELHYREKGSLKGVAWIDSNDTQSLALGEEMKEFVKANPYQAEARFSDTFYLLLSDWICGFTIATRSSRKWGWLHIGNLQEYNFEKDLEDTIAIPEIDLEMIKAVTDRTDNLSTNEHVQKLDFNPDHIEHKGEGTIVLLHGAPGLGKTYTIECISETSERPLLRLTCAELGLDPAKLESKLEMYLRWAERWQAIVLIDEADVFLHKRIRFDSSTQREALVAVFLKALEYYSGILFLTTNRVEVFDLAVIDRVTLVVQFSPLDATRRTTVINNCIKKLEKDGRFKLVVEAKKKFTGIDEEPYDWNGREIVQVLRLAGMFAQSANNNMDSSRRKSTIQVSASNIEKAMEVVRRHGAVHNVSQNVSREGSQLKAEGYRSDYIG